MRKSCSMAVALVFAGVLASFSGSSQGSLLVNGGFEDTDSNGSHGDSWGSFGNAGFNAFFGANGHASLFADNVGNFGGVFQTGIPGSAGTPYRFTLSDTRIESNFDARLRFGLEFYPADDATKLSETLVQIADPGVEINNGVYTIEATAPAGTVFVRPVILFDNVNSSGGSRNVFVFDSNLNVVPEPTTFAALGACAVLSLSRRRVTTSN
jgi:hypothetical protein